MRKGIRLAIVTAVFATSVAVCASAAVAAPPFASPVEIARLTFEPGSADFSQIGPTVIAPDATLAYWGKISAVKHAGASSLWCAGKAVAGGATRAYGNYPKLTRGMARLSLPELADFYGSNVSFYYLMPSLGGADADSFGIGWQRADAGGNTVGSSTNHSSFDKTSTWIKSRTYDLSGANDRASLTRTRGILTFRFMDQLETFQLPLTGLGVAIDDVVVSGYKFGPVRNLTATYAAGTGVKLAWNAPTRAANSSVAEDRPITYRVWRSYSGADAWTELTAAGRITGRTLVDSSAKPGYLYDYVVQVFEPGAGAQRGAQTKVNIAPAATLKLGNPVAPLTMYTTRASSVYGYLYPKQTSRKAVRIYKYRLVGRVWKSYGYLNAYTSAIPGVYTKSKYAASIRLPYRGTWKLRSYYVYAAGKGMWSTGYDKVIVK